MNDMRSLTDKTEPLFEMPFLTTTEENFFLPDRDYNRRQADRLIASSYHTIEETDLVVLGDLRHGDDGEIFLYRRDSGLLTYFVRYEIRQVAPFGRCVTQVALWRSAAPGLRNVAQMVFETYLLANFDAIMSDEMQTRDGQRFWIDRMGEAIQDRRTVGLMIDGAFHTYDGTKPLDQWIGEMDAWGDEDEHITKLFVIANK